MLAADYPHFCPTSPLSQLIWWEYTSATLHQIRLQGNQSKLPSRDKGNMLMKVPNGNEALTTATVILKKEPCKNIMQKMQRELPLK